MIYNYHTHTYRCSHASGTAEEYIQRAIQCGIKYMGFSEHMPYICSDGHESHFRVPVSEAGEYVAEISGLREKYKTQLDIKIGFEMEYYPAHFSKMLKCAIDFGAEYLILGEHFTREEHPDGVFTMTDNYSTENLQEYVSCVVDGIESGVFTYIAHPDCFKFLGDTGVYQKEMRKICAASREFNIPLELNFLGIRSNRHYPDEAFWEVAGQEKSPVTFGFDAHTVQDAFDGVSLDTAKKMVEKYNLNYIGIPKLILIQNLCKK